MSFRLPATLALLLTCLVSPLSAQLVGSEQSTLLIVRFAPDATGLPGSPEDMPDLLADRRSGILEQFAAELGSPDDSFPLVSARLPRDIRNAMDQRDAGRLLQSYFVLRYANVARLIAAKERLELDPRFLWAKQSQTARFSASPTDPEYPVESSAITGQWGPPTLTLPSAWDLIEGTAYVGVIDNGIQISNPGIHPDLVQAYRPQFGQNFAEGASVDEGDSTGPFAGHGTHVAGIIAASANNAQGVAGTCWRCSLMIGRASHNSPQIGLQDAYIINAIHAFASRGAQVLNLSLGDDQKAANHCSIGFNWLIDPYCLALQFAAARDVVMVAASGNNKRSRLNFPAEDPLVIAVGGTQINGLLWNQEVTLPQSNARNNIVPPPPEPSYFGLELGQNYGPNQTLVAPARDILSTFYQGRDWNPYLRCGTSHPFFSTQIQTGQSDGYGPDSRRYGICTGTSMATAFVSGVAALVRSADPLLSRTAVRTSLTQHASRAFNYDQDWGFGLPNAQGSVWSVLNGNSRMTPLFAFYDSVGDGYFFTTVPQMATAAITYNLWPTWPTPHRYQSSSTVGNIVSGYALFPAMQPLNKRGPRPGQDGEIPRARIKVFTTHKDALERPLVPLYRYSYKDSSVVRHVYATSTVAPPWQLDGVEGYLYPPNISQPPGTVAIHRWVKSPITYVLVPTGDESFWSSRGFSPDGAGVLGYAYLTNGSVFADVPYGHPNQGPIESMYYTEITLGCGVGPPTYCPTSNVTRGQMAAFGGRAVHAAGWVPPAYSSIFPDVPSWYSLRDWIMQTYYDGIMGQCPSSPGNFCPDASILRDEMAQVLVRIKYGVSYVPPDPTSAPFGDVPVSHPYAKWINQIKVDGITLGCGGGNYCPTLSVTREGMALFLSRTLGLLQ